MMRHKQTHASKYEQILDNLFISYYHKDLDLHIQTLYSNIYLEDFIRFSNLTLLLPVSNCKQ